MLRSDGQLCCRSTSQSSFVLGELLGNLAVAVILHDLGAVSDEKLWVDQAVDVVPCWLKFLSCGVSMAMSFGRDR